MMRLLHIITQNKPKGKIRKEYVLSRFYGYIQECLRSWSDIYAQSNCLTDPVLLQDPSSSSTPINLIVNWLVIMVLYGVRIYSQDE